jgi:hypothetical protein
VDECKPLVVGNCTGFAVNRVFFPYTMSACLLLDLGCDPYAIDNAIKMFGMPMGPFRLGDLAGGAPGPFRIFGISLPARSADALPATLYGHSTWRPLSHAER